MNVTKKLNAQYYGNVTLMMLGSEAPYAQNPENVRLRKWLDARRGRAKELHNVMFGSDRKNVISMYKRGFAPVYVEDMHKIKCGMLRVQHQERMSGIVVSENVSTT